MTAPAPYNTTAQIRRAMLGKVHIARKELGLDEATYRAVLLRITGQQSASLCSMGQLATVLKEFGAKGWKPAVFVNPDKQTEPATGKQTDPRPTAPKAASTPMAKKARAMWISLHQLGVVRDPSDRALESFGRRQLRVDKLEWADAGQSYKLIEALKAMAERAGWSQIVPAGDRQLPTLRRNLVAAMCAKLGRPDISKSCADLDATIHQLAAEIRALQPDPEA
ncbi:MAG TPA: regulatory protein GemA [Caulobacteraceae bacterium]|nr:regulatory protein GemA [Caulobacteraceae bacterium]